MIEALRLPHRWRHGRCKRQMRPTLTSMSEINGIPIRRYPLRGPARPALSANTISSPASRAFTHSGNRPLPFPAAELDRELRKELRALAKPRRSGTQ